MNPLKNETAVILGRSSGFIQRYDRECGVFAVSMIALRPFAVNLYIFQTEVKQ
jgi:hypothetical protein